LIKNASEYFLRGMCRRIKKYPKASEFLWGALNNLVYALGLILYGERPSTHSKIKDIINKISVDFNKPEIADLFKASAEVLHANFYHDFLDEDSFNYHAENVERLLLKLAQILEKSTSKS